MTRNFLVFIFGLFLLLVFSFAFCYVSIYSEVLIAGEPEWRAAEERRRDGIPIPSPLWTRLSALAGPLNVVAPRPDGG